MDLVSAIITTHNRKELLKRAIESVFAQTYPNIELVVVDDHSDDGTSEICKDSRINYIFIPKEESHGGNYARNLGIKASHGKYCAFLDDDDYWLPEKIEKQVHLIQEKDCELVHCGRRLEYIRPNGIEYKDTVPDERRAGDMSTRILSTICTTTTCMLVSRQALFDIGLFDEDLRFWQEYEISIRLAQRKAFYFVKEPLCVYRIDENDRNRLTNKFYDWKIAVKYIYQKHAALYANLSWFDRFKVKSLYWRDAMNRSKLSKLKCQYRLYYILSLPSMVLLKFKQI